MNHIRIISREEAIKYCTRSENQFYDRKSKRIDGRSLQKIACAFANSDGGEIAIGIEDDFESNSPLKTWDGFERTEEADSHLHNIVKNITPAIDFSYEFLRIDGELNNTVLLISIERSKDVHQTADQCIYQRLNSSSLQVKGVDNLTRLSYSKGKTSVEDEILDDEEVTLEICKSEGFKDFRNQLPYSDVDDLQYLRRLKLIDSALKPKYAAVLLFHPCPSDVLPMQCAVKVVRYTTSQDDPDRNDLNGIYPIEGPSYKIIHDAFVKIKEVISDVYIWHINGLSNPVYPDEAIWEVLTNSIIHRDYSISDNVQISIYNDRIDFKSPGRLPAYVKMQEILSTRFSRNPKLVRMLSRYKNPPNKEIGEGMNTTFQSVRKYGLVDPEIKEEGGYFVVTLNYKKMGDHADIVMKFVENNGSIVNQQARELLGLKKSSEAYSVLEKLKIDGKIEYLNNHWVRKTDDMNPHVS